MTLLVAGLLAGLAAHTAADPPRPGTTDSGLNESEAATLWSKQPDDTYITNEAYRSANGENRTLIHEIANGTDLTFTRPPSTAKRWTRYAHDTHQPGDRNTSVYPPHADPRDGAVIKDAHATIFALSPATITHVAPDDTRFYVRPTGRLLGTVDYGIEPPNETRRDGTRVRWRVLDDDIEETRLYADDEHIATGDGSHRPDLPYEVPSTTGAVTLEADITVTLEKTIIEPQLNGPSNRTTAQVTRSMTVRDARNVSVYDLVATSYRVGHPDGRTSVLVLQTHPWRGYTLDGADGVSVDGIWRFYTGREPAWDTLVHATRENTTEVDSSVLPVYVHAYPSRIGPRTKPEYGGPTLDRIWGSTHRSPAPAIDENVSVEVVEDTYESTYGIAVTLPPTVDTDAGVTVHGLVAGTETNATEIESGTAQVRPTSLTAEVIDRNLTAATVRLTLVDRSTGEPIDLTNRSDDRPAGSATTNRSKPEFGAAGYVSIADHQVWTNASGQATVVLTMSGTYTARYVPRSWLDTSRPYTASKAAVTWHPLTSVGGWLVLATAVALALAPIAVAAYAGQRLATIVGQFDTGRQV